MKAYFLDAIAPSCFSVTTGFDYVRLFIIAIMRYSLLDYAIAVWHNTARYTFDIAY